MITKKHYNKLTIDLIKAQIEQEGFKPLLIQDPPNTEYNKHTHPETKLLAILDGGMCITIEGKHYNIEAGDKVVIPGKIPHSAKVWETGCTFYWSEKLV
jgi:quercetin dioxygenase-like cupin family protein